MENLRAPAPRWITLALTAFTAFLVPYYWVQYGPQNFLWLSDVALFLTVVALWRSSRLIVSMLCIGVLPLELFWNLDFFLHLATGVGLGLADYMFDPAKTLLLRGVSLFHVVLPIVWIFLLRRWGYDRRALVRQTLLLWSVLLATYALTDPAENINWVFVPQELGWAWLPGWAWLVAYLVIVPTAIHAPLHALLLRWSGTTDARPNLSA